LLFLEFGGGRDDDRTRDGRQLGFGGWLVPDAFAKLYVDGKVVLETPVQATRVSPTWPDQRKANYRVRSGARCAWSSWDSNPINNHPICVSDMSDLQAEVSSEGPVKVSWAAAVRSCR